MEDMQSWWADPQRRDRLVDDLVRYVSKFGELEDYSAELAALGEFLTEPEVVALYERLADERLEFEWRDEFVGHFDGSAGFLPPPAMTRAEYEAGLATGEIRWVEAGESRSEMRARREGAQRRWRQFWRRE